jgi:hypothetical protein
MRLPIQAMQAILIKPLGHEEEPWFRSSIVDFRPEQELVVVLPSPRDRLDRPPPKPTEGAGTTEEEDELTDTLFSRGTELEVQISFPDGIRRFSSVIRKLDLSFGGSLYLDWPTEGTRIQRREHVRVEVRFPTAVKFKERGTEIAKVVHGDTIDLSAGGVRLQLADAIADDTEIRLDIDTDSLRGKPFKGRVVRSGAIEAKRARQGLDCWVAVEFVGVDPKSRKEMTQLVFDIQRQQMKRSQ